METLGRLKSNLSSGMHHLSDLWHRGKLYVSNIFSKRPKMDKYGETIPLYKEIEMKEMHHEPTEKRGTFPKPPTDIPYLKSSFDVPKPKYNSEFKKEIHDDAEFKKYAEEAKRKFAEISAMFNN